MIYNYAFETVVLNLSYFWNVWSFSN